MLETIILGYVHHYLVYVAILGCIAGGVASWIYVPVFGKQIGACAFAGAAGLMAYQLGYNARAALDQTIKLEEQLAATKEQLAQSQADLKANSKIAEDSAKREQEATKVAIDLQSKVQEYEQSLKEMADNAGQTETVVVHDGKGKNCPPVHKSNSCVLTDRDINSLRGIGASGNARH